MGPSKPHLSLSLQSRRAPATHQWYRSPVPLPGKLRQGPLSRGWTRCGPAPRTRHLWTPLASPTQSRTVGPLAPWFERQLSILQSSTQFKPPPQTQIHTNPTRHLARSAPPPAPFSFPSSCPASLTLPGSAPCPREPVRRPSEGAKNGGLPNVDREAARALSIWARSRDACPEVIPKLVGRRRHRP